MNQKSLLWRMLVATAAASLIAAATPAVVLDDFSDPARWTLAPSDGVALALGRDEGTLRMDFDFRGRGGWAAIRRAVEIELPANYRFTLRLRGETPPNTLELKFIDPSGENVWWVRKPAWEFPRQWSAVIADKRNIEFAWGPSTTRVPTRIGFIEVTVTAATGGKGSVWLDELTFEELPPEAGAPILQASSSLAGQTADRAMDARSDTAWRSSAAGTQSIRIDMRDHRAFGGLVLDWIPDEHATTYEVQTSSDGTSWMSARTVRGGNGGRDYLQLPNAAARFVRVELTAANSAHYGIREITIQPVEFGDRAIHVYQSMARNQSRGLFPRQLLGEYAYWTMFGVDGDEGTKPLLCEDGAIETPAGFTLEPFIRVDGRLLTWADVETAHTLEGRFLPLPTVTWRHPKVTLEISPFASGPPSAPVMFARYRVRNASDRASRAQLFVAVRPLRVTPPWHVLNILELTAPIRTVAWNGERVVVDGSWHVVPLSKPAGVASSTFDEGDATEWFAKVNAAPPRSIDDPQAHASAVMVWDLTLAPGQQQDIEIAMPMHKGDATIASRDVDARRQESIRYWSTIADRVEIEIPAARDLVDTARANVAYILAGRDGPAIRGGPRNYDRSWIRDGSLSSAMLLRFGFAGVVRDYIRWFAPYQFDDGKVPCCVDMRGADPVPEHDSHGEFIYLAAIYTRLTGDNAIAAEVWPHVEAAANYIDALRRRRRTAEYRQPEKQHFFGLLPESISHEGYSAKPMHSYWDDFWALRGLRDAAWLAARLGKSAAAKRIAASGEEFERDLHASIRRTLEVHNIEYIPGAADIGDFDPTSTTIGIDPAGEIASLPHDALLHTFTRYWNEAESRMEGRTPWTLYTPYEVRQVGTFVRLGWRDRAHRLLGFLLDDRRPRGWKNWAEVVAQRYRAPVYLGDIPHLWVASDFIRSFLDMLAYERQHDEALVLAAGVPESWLIEGVRVRNLRTFWGPLDLDIRGNVARISGVKVPKGGIVLALPGTVRSATVNGRAAPVQDGRVMIREVPAKVIVVLEEKALAELPRLAVRLRIPGDGLRMPPGGIVLRWGGKETAVRKLPADVRIP